MPTPATKLTSNSNPVGIKGRDKERDLWEDLVISGSTQSPAGNGA